MDAIRWLIPLALTTWALLGLVLAWYYLFVHHKRNDGTRCPECQYPK